MTLVETPRPCPDCGVEPGWTHERGCDVERCSVCGLQAIGCEHGDRHDPTLSFWTGYWPGDETIRLLGLADDHRIGGHNELATLIVQIRNKRAGE